MSCTIGSKKIFFLMQEVMFHFLFDASHRRAIHQELKLNK